jgi:carbon-monoxide dehydrogenase small subunit
VKIPTEVTVNGRRHRLDVDTRSVLANVLRDELRLTGTHVGCGTGSCGACTVLLDGKTVKSCSILAADVDGCEVTTIEGLARDGRTLHPIQEAFATHHGMQCGYCTPGMILSALHLLSENSDPSEDQIRHAIAGNLCRCTGYQFIVEAIRAAAGALRTKKSESLAGAESSGRRVP